MLFNMYKHSNPCIHINQFSKKKKNYCTLKPVLVPMVQNHRNDQITRSPGNHIPDVTWITLIYRYWCLLANTTWWHFVIFFLPRMVRFGFWFPLVFIWIISLAERLLEWPSVCVCVCPRAGISPSITGWILMKLRMDSPVHHAQCVWQTIEHRSKVKVKVTENTKTTIWAITFEPEVVETSG